MSFWKHFFGKKRIWGNLAITGFTLLVFIFEIKTISEEGPSLWAAIILIFITSFFMANILLNYSGYKKNKNDNK